ncbi:type I-F CRISPR-associated protein Csy3 [Moraxella boevrei]|uniref:type I-F CRISPR-associated protein Csy3 n=1 Tax=Faucicola boevrei TaxID=346665 RepID=UPI003735F064
MAKQPKNELPEVLAFSRKIEPSDALMQAGLWENKANHEAWQNIELHDKRNRATKSQYNLADKEKTQPNIVWGDDASIPHDMDTLKVTFTVKFLGNIDQAVANNRPEFLDKLQNAYQAYQQEITLLPLAKRYVQNLANGRFLWRNRVGAEQIEIKITDTENRDKSWIFNAHNIALQDFDITDAQLDDLAQYVADSFSTSKYLLLKVEAFAKVGLGQRVFPSQEMRDKDKDNKSKFLYQIKTPKGLCAGMHSEKIGNAIRTIDTWYTCDENQIVKQAIAIEPYGSVPTQGKAYRMSKTDLYSLMVKFINNEAMAIDEKHFVVANLIRGGVFGGKDS